jgi:tripartite-type tricarboxylate transporter receptor subunit TctC
MNVLRREFLQLIGVVAAACASVETGSAQNFPTRPITMIVPFAAGGTVDVTARIVGERMSRTLGQQIVVENIVGAGGTTGSIRAMRASPDGYTIEMGNMGTHAAVVALYPNLAYRPDSDFEPIGMVSTLPAVVVARKDFPPKDIKEFIPYVKANFNKLNVAHSGVGSVFFTTCLLLNSILNVKPTLVPFNGGGPAMNALAGTWRSPFHNCRPAPSRLLQLEQRGAIRCCRTCRHPTKPAYRNSKHQPGTACSLPRLRRSRSSKGSPTR